MRSRLALTLVLCSLAASPTFAAGAKPRKEPPAGQTPAVPLAEQQATHKYNSGLEHLTKAKQIAGELAAPDVKDRAKLEQRLAKEYEQAIEDLRRATELSAGMHDAFSSLGYALRKTGQFEAALAAYDRALVLQPDYAPAIEYRAEAHLGLGRLAEVKTAYTKLFAGDRARADELMAAMEAWVATHRESPGDVGAEAVAEFAGWVAERKQAAGEAPPTAKAGTETW